MPVLAVYAHLTQAAGGAQNLQLWQAINLFGAPFAAMVLLRKVVEDVSAWRAARRERVRDRELR